MAMEQTFQGITELDFAVDIARQLAERGDDESQLKSAQLMTLAAKGRLEISKQLRIIGKEAPPAKTKKDRLNLPPDPRPPIVINQQFVNSQPKPE